MNRLLIATATIGVLVSAAFAQNPATSQVLQFLESISGYETVAGEHNAEPNSDPTKSTDSIFAITGMYPALWSGDFLYEASNIATRWTMIHEAKAEWDKGALVQLMWHVCPPTCGEPCPWRGDCGVLSHLSDAQWDSLITDGTALNDAWKKEMDGIVPYLQYLKDNGVEVLFRPLHEMNQSAFWWGGRPGPNGTARLYQITHDYLVKTKGLTNLIWEWDLQDFPSLITDVNSYDPGSSYWDILTLDVYGSDGQMYTGYKYGIISQKAGNKPIAIGECAQLPTDSVLQRQPKWTFFMGWATDVFSYNTPAQIQDVYNSPNVITLGQMPGWKALGIRQKIWGPPGGFQLHQNYPNPFNPSTVVKYTLSKPEVAVLKVYNVLGQKVAEIANGRQAAGNHAVTFDASRMSSGVYFYLLKAGSYISTKKMLYLK